MRRSETHTHTPTKCGYKETVREKLYTGDTLTVKRTCALLITMLAAGVKNQLMRKIHCLWNQSFLFKLLNFSGAKRKKLGTDKEKRSSSRTMSQCMTEWHINVAHFRVDWIRDEKTILFDLNWMRSLSQRRKMWGIYTEITNFYGTLSWGTASNLDTLKTWARQDIWGTKRWTLNRCFQLFLLKYKGIFLHCHWMARLV